jgi:uncharacterized membrane protein
VNGRNEAQEIVGLWLIIEAKVMALHQFHGQGFYQQHYGVVGIYTKDKQ